MNNLYLIMRFAIILFLILSSFLFCKAQSDSKKTFSLGINMSLGAQINYTGTNSTIFENAELLGEGREFGISTSYRFLRRVDARLGFCGNRQSMFAYLDNGDLAYLRVQSLHVPIVFNIYRPFTSTTGAYIGLGGYYEIGDVTQNYKSVETTNEFEQVGILGALGLALTSDDQKYRGYVELKARQDVALSLISRGSLNVGVGFDMFLF